MRSMTPHRSRSIFFRMFRPLTGTEPTLNQLNRARAVASATSGSVPRWNPSLLRRWPTRLKEKSGKTAHLFSGKLPIALVLAGGVMAASAQEASGKDAPVAVITTFGCKYCMKVKSKLKQKGISFREVDLDKFPDALRAVKEATGQLTVPQVFVNGVLVGGADETIGEIESGRFRERIKNASNPPLPPSVERAVDQAREAKKESVSSKDVRISGPPITDPARMRILLEAKRIIRATSSDRKGLVGNVRVSGALWWGKTEPLSFDADAAADFLAQKIPEAIPSAEEGRRAIWDMLRAQMLQVVVWKADREATLAQGPEGPLRCVLRFAEDAPGPKLKEPLNTPFTFVGAARAPVQVSADLRRRMLALKGQFLSEDGSRVDYEAMKKSAEFQEFVESTAELQRVDPARMVDDERKAFFINLYNILIIHATVALGAPSNVAGRLKFFPGACYEVGGSVYSADDIEHGVLRCNRATPSSLWAILGKPQLGSGPFHGADPRRLSVLAPPVDPRIHFALNCGAKSCPPIRVFGEENLDEGLSIAAQAFLEERTEVRPEKGEVELSMILKWYGFDFGSSKREMLEKVCELMTPGSEKRNILEEMLSKRSSISVKYTPYDWDLNA